MRRFPRGRTHVASSRRRAWKQDRRQPRWPPDRVLRYARSAAARLRTALDRARRERSPGRPGFFPAALLRDG